MERIAAIVMISSEQPSWFEARIIFETIGSYQNKNNEIQLFTILYYTKAEHNNVSIKDHKIFSLQSYRISAFIPC